MADGTNPSTRKRKATSPAADVHRPEIPPSPGSSISEDSSISATGRWLRGQPDHIEHWLRGLPDPLDGYAFDDEEPPHRPLSVDNCDINREKYSWYCTSSYLDALAASHSFPTSSPAGLTDYDETYCSAVLLRPRINPDLLLFHADVCDSLAGQSEYTIMMSLHIFVAPSAEYQYMLDKEPEFKGLAEYYDHPWIKTMAFDGPPPQPDHTYGFHPSKFTKFQRRKLNMNPSGEFYHVAKHDLWFPFLTSHCKCGRRAREIGERAALHSMTVAMQAIVNLYRRANRAWELHRTIRGFSIVYDEKSAVIFGHYAEIDGQRTSFYRDVIKKVDLTDETEKWTCWRFVLNVCQYYSSSFLQQLQEVIDELPDPAEAAEVRPGPAGGGGDSTDAAPSIEILD
ncbi:uncharacterized protein A1O5_13435 [Cladophialophora psammophila CBS 110553]|uniref:DUF7924 domain-containing protein n=1 Tax=Cladophialophora psammophila CBS 110553 TaxID=1182543 RepID=W9VCV7_9EURO|nr:uncharacterized protein A1O5_13435 [Cladophialophora psammophila CBS 110553]EXJ53313.1 hypothetical protein A1O5_13435 [Cladophialophora psammophila CBS 110553]